MGMNLDGPLYLQRKGFLGREKHRLLDIGPQTIYFAREDQIREFVSTQGKRVSDEKLDAEIKRLTYF